jgi:hypothetical protein
VGARPHPADRERRQQIGALEGMTVTERVELVLHPRQRLDEVDAEEHETETFLEPGLHVAALLPGTASRLGSAAAASSVRP